MWASGFRPDYRWLDFPTLDEMGLPRTRRGDSEVPGLFFAGMLWETNQTSATLFGPRVDAPHIAQAMGLALPDEEPIRIPRPEALKYRSAPDEFRARPPYFADRP